MLHNRVGGGNGMVGGTRTTAAPTAGQQKVAERGSTVCSALTEAMKIIELADTTQEFSRNY